MALYVRVYVPGVGSDGFGCDSYTIEGPLPASVITGDGGELSIVTMAQPDSRIRSHRKPRWVVYARGEWTKIVSGEIE